MKHKIDEITEALCKQLSKLACAGKIDDKDLPEAAKRTNRRYGVVVWHNKVDVSKLKLELVTKDDIHISTVIDLRDASREYFIDLAQMLRERIDGHREKRDAPIFDVSPMSVSAALAMRH